MMKRPLVSIAINNYNYAPFLREAIDSALNQTYPHTEVIVVDDGSTDDSPHIIASYGERVVGVLKENGGQASAINAGFAACRGEVVIFLDADDVLLPEAVERVVGVFEERPELAKVQFRLQLMDAEGRLMDQVIPSPNRWMPDGDMKRHVMRFFNVPRPPTSGNAFSAAVLRRFLPIPEEQLELYRMGADRYLNDLCLIFGPVASLAEVCGLYRVHGKNLHASVRSVDLPFLRRILLRCAYNRARQKQFLDELYSIKIRQIGPWDLPFARDRMIHRKLEPENHPFAESILSLCVQGCLSSLLYPGIRWPKRTFYALWFLAMLAAPKGLAGALAQEILYPGSSRKGTTNKLLATFRRNLVREA
jgi:glycosyltransferase involved in cell wall biosynthesis